MAELRLRAEGTTVRIDEGPPDDGSVTMPWLLELIAADGDGTPLPIGTCETLPGGGWRLAGEADAFTATATLRPVDGLAAAAVDLEVAFGGTARVDRGVRIGLELPVDQEPPSWLVPGVLYGENRPVACRRRFPRYERGAHDPADMRSERWGFRADRAATPSVFGWSGGSMAALAVDEVTPLGQAGIGLEGGADRVRIWVDLPFREEPIAYRGFDDPAHADVRTHAWSPGEAVRISMTVAVGESDRHGYVPFLRHLHARGTARYATRPWMKVDEAAALAADGLLAWHYRPAERVLYETAAFERELDGSAAGAGDGAAMHVGWVSGAPWAAQLLAWGRRTGSRAHTEAGLDVLDHIADNVSPSGTFWAAWTRDAGWGAGWSPRGTIHANTIGQATLFYLRALAAEGRHGHPHPSWDAAVRSTLDTVARRQRPDGNLGTYHDAESGAVTEWDGAGGLPFVAALLDAANRYDEPAYREAAVRAGSFYRRYVDAELIYGAPEDVHLAPSSEDGYNAVIAFMALHRATSDPEWLDVARRAADWTLTFRYSYNVAFGRDTMLGAYDFRTRGADQASPANQHLHHFGLVCLPELIELSRATGDDHYRLRAIESLEAWRQFVARRDGDFNAMRGMVSERFYQTDCFRAKGSLLPLSHAWTAGVLLFACLTALEDPDAVPA